MELLFTCFVQIDLAPVGKDDDADGGDADYPLLHCVTFTLLSGAARSLIL